MARRPTRFTPLGLTALAALALFAAGAGFVHREILARLASDLYALRNFQSASAGKRRAQARGT